MELENGFAEEDLTPYASRTRDNEQRMRYSIDLAHGASDNGFAVMLADLVRQNLEAKPEKKRDFKALKGAVAIVVDDAGVALTLRFSRGRLTIFDGISGIPDVTLRGSSDIILSLSNIPLVTPLRLPIPTDRAGVDVIQSIVKAIRGGTLRIYGLFFHTPLLMRLTRVVSIH